MKEPQRGMRQLTLSQIPKKHWNDVFSKQVLPYAYSASLLQSQFDLPIQVYFDQRFPINLKPQLQKVPLLTGPVKDKVPDFYSGFNDVNGKANNLRRSFTALIRKFLRPKDLFQCSMVRKMKLLKSNVGSIQDIQPYRMVDFQQLTTWQYTENLTKQLHQLKRSKYLQVQQMKKQLQLDPDMTTKNMAKIVRYNKNWIAANSGQSILDFRRREAKEYKNLLRSQANAYLIPMPDANCLLNAAFNCLSPADRDQRHLLALQQLIPTNPTINTLQQVSQFFQVVIYTQGKDTDQSIALRLQRYNLYLPIIFVIIMNDQQGDRISHACVYKSRYQIVYPDFTFQTQLLLQGWAYITNYNYVQVFQSQRIFGDEQYQWPRKPLQLTIRHDSQSKIRYEYPGLRFYSVYKAEQQHQTQFQPSPFESLGINGFDVKKILRRRLGVELANVVLRSFEIDDDQWYQQFGDDVDYLQLYDHRDYYLSLMDERDALGSEFQEKYFDQLSDQQPIPQEIPTPPIVESQSSSLSEITQQDQTLPSFQGQLQYQSTHSLDDYDVCMCPASAEQQSQPCQFCQMCQQIEGLTLVHKNCDDEPDDPGEPTPVHGSGSDPNG